MPGGASSIAAGFAGALRQADEPESFYDFFARISPELEPPHHLQPIVDLIDRAERETVRAVVSTPPQHGKTVTLTHALLRNLRRTKKRNVYATYAADRAYRVSNDLKRLSQRHAATFLQGSRIQRLAPFGGTLFFTGVGGGLTGEPADGLMVLDDLIKNREDANSKTIRDSTMGWLRSTAFSRLHPGASVILVMTRWHPDDPAGQLIKEGWEFVNLPAVNDGSDPRRAHGEALWPAERPLGFLYEQKKLALPADWSALWQGQPVADGQEVFGPPTYYDPDELPKNGYRISFGFDPAYSDKTVADYSVLVCMYFAYDHAAGEWIGYVVDCLRKQMNPDPFKSLARRRALAITSRPRIIARLSGTEYGLLALYNGRHEPLPLIQTPIKGGKLASAQNYAAAWNRGLIRVPSGSDERPAPTWVAPFVEEHKDFTGLGDRHDDQVDAGVSAHLPFVVGTRQRRPSGIVPQ